MAAITHPFPNFNGSSVELLLKLGHGWVITYTAYYGCNYLSMSLSQLISVSERGPRYHIFYWLYINMQISLVSLSLNIQFTIQCKPDISRLVGSMERYRDISGSAIYRATAMSQNPGQVFQRVVSGDGAFVCFAANSARRQRISWHLSKFDVALPNRVVEFQTKAVCA